MEPPSSYSEAIEMQHAICRFLADQAQMAHPSLNPAMSPSFPQELNGQEKRELNDLLSAATRYLHWAR
jgi:hypothetical protein